MMSIFLSPVILSSISMMRDGGMACLSLFFMMDSTDFLVQKDRRASLCFASLRDIVTWETVAPMVTS